MQASPDPRTGDFIAFRQELLAGWPVSAANLVVLSAIDSTNALARRILEKTSPGGRPASTLFAAWSQSGGRGRRGRTWASGPGQGAWVSLLEPLAGARELARLPTLLPVILCQALRGMGVRDCGLRWPNDLVVEGRKLGGVLIEAVTVGDRPAAAILGFGVNFRPPDPARVPRPTVGVAQLVDSFPSVGRLTRRLADEVIKGLASPPEGLVRTYGELSVHQPGEHLICRLGGETVEGPFAGFDAQGFLQLGAGSELRTISAGELIER